MPGDNVIEFPTRFGAGQISSAHAVFDPFRRAAENGILIVTINLIVFELCMLSMMACSIALRAHLESRRF